MFKLLTTGDQKQGKVLQLLSFEIKLAQSSANQQGFELIRMLWKFNTGDFHEIQVQRNRTHDNNFTFFMNKFTWQVSKA